MRATDSSKLQKRLPSAVLSRDWHIYVCHCASNPIFLSSSSCALSNWQCTWWAMSIPYNVVDGFRLIKTCWQQQNQKWTMHTCPQVNQTHAQIDFDHVISFHFQFIEGWVETDWNLFATVEPVRGAGHGWEEGAKRNVPAILVCVCAHCCALSVHAS